MTALVVVLSQMTLTPGCLPPAARGAAHDIPGGPCSMATRR